MRDYEQVNRERYEKDDFSGEGIERNIYSPINPVGNYGVFKITQLLRKYLMLIKSCCGKGYDEIKMLDCGCGTGVWTRTLANLLGRTENIYGFEFSKNRLAYCKSMNPAIHYFWGDIAGEWMNDKISTGEFFELSNCRFDGILAVDVFSHLRKSEDIEKALNNVSKALADSGLFLWYDINAKTHDTNFEADTQGYSEEEMDKYARNNGFKLKYSNRMYGAIKVLGRSYSTYYNVNDKWRDIVFMEIIEPVLLKFNHLDNIRIYMKNET